MKVLSVLTVLLVVATPVSAADTSAPLDCKAGPITRNFGGAPWLAYACNDDGSLVLVSAPGSKATPFYFMLHWENGGHHIFGEGTGDKAVTDAAARELQALSESEISKIVSLARNSQPKR